MEKIDPWVPREWSFVNVHYSGEEQEIIYENDGNKQGKQFPQFNFQVCALVILELCLMCVCNTCEQNHRITESFNWGKASKCLSQGCVKT